MAAEGILVNGATEVLKKLSAFLAEEISLAWGVKDELQNLKKSLDMILAVMNDAEKKQVKSEAVRLWLVELKDIAYEAEDVLDSYSYQSIHQHQMTCKMDKVCNFFSSSNPIVFRLKIAHEIKNINKKFNDIAKRKESLGLQITELGTTSHTMNIDENNRIRETDSTVDQSLRIIGRDNDKSNIISMLLHYNPHSRQDKSIEVIPIVGMGGLGKTTLAQLIYNDDKVKKHFELKMWVCVSNDFDVKKLCIKIIESITNDKCDNLSNIDVITLKLQQYLSGKKYLLVLDDVWNKKRADWVNFRKHLLVGANGSKIIVTTRSDSVASIMGGELHSYKLGILTETESWSLFKERVAFGHVGGPVETPSLTTIGKELVGKCGGLPLAIIFLGSLLRDKEETEWNVINENQIWDQSSNEDESRILPILKLSYDHLPSQLKQCFSYLSLFPNYPEFLQNSLILLWMVEGFIPQPFGKNNIQVGNEYFNSLLYNSFFQVVEKDEVGRVYLFEMHDLVHDLAKYVAHDCECLSVAARENMRSIPNNIRRLGLYDFNEGMSKTVCKALQDKTNLRTLLCNGTVEKVENVFDGLKRLRIFDLSGAPNIKEIPSSLMDNLKHLRYLSLSNTQIAKLPKSLTRLYHLQTLVLQDCVNLKELPKGMGKLINLRYLWLPDDMYLPREIGQLSSLRTLYPCNMENKDSGGCGLEVLEGLNLLIETLEINHLRNVTSGKKAQRANLMGKKNLHRIYLSWHKYCSHARKYDVEEVNCEDEEEVVLEALQPHPNLKSIIIDQYFGVKLPRWMGDPSCLPNLVLLQLNDCPKCEQVVEFGKLPSLKDLRFINMNGIKFLGNEFYYNNNNNNHSSGVVRSSSSNSNNHSSGGGEEVVLLFPLLKLLVLSDMSCLEEWVEIPPTAVTTCFPCLEQLHIYRCLNLRITPTRFPSVKKLNLEMINERVAVPLITTNLLNSLHDIQLTKIKELRFLPQSLLQGSNVKVLRVIDCLDFQGFLPNEEEKEGLQQQTQSSFLQLLALLDLPNLKFLPDIRTFTSLEELYILDCKSLKPIPKEDLTCLPSSLEHLKLVQIRNVNDFEWHK